MSENCGSINNKEVGKRIKEIRESNKLTQEEMAEILKVNPNAIRAYERGAYGISKEVMVRFRQHFHVSIDYLLFGSSDDSDSLLFLIENASETDKMKILMRLMVYFVKEKKRIFRTDQDNDEMSDIFKSIFGDG